MSKPMEGVRILEVAQYTFVPAAGAVLADWGADVIKIEHPVHGDAQRGFLRIGAIPVTPDRNTVMEHPNRGKRSVVLNLKDPVDLEKALALIERADAVIESNRPGVAGSHALRACAPAWSSSQMARAPCR